MPRPGEAPAPLYKGLPYGANALVNDMSEAIPEDPDLFDDTFDELEGMEPADEMEAFLLSGSDRPDEPITAGMSFGDGPNIASVRLRTETRREMTMRVSSVLATEGEQSPGVKKFLEALDRGL